MPRVRVVIRDHDGSPQKPRFWAVLGEIQVYVNRLIETKGAFIVIMSMRNAERMLTNTNKELLRSRGFEAIPPPEMTAGRTLVLRDVDPYITSNFSEDEILDSITECTGHCKVIKIPTNPRMLKIMFVDASETEIARFGFNVMNQQFTSESIEKERYVDIRQCLKCYQFDHITKKCPVEGEHTVCSECGATDHRYTVCTSTVKKCLNCHGPHRTLAYKCPERKRKVKEIEQKQKQKEKKEAEPQLGPLTAKLNELFDNLTPSFVTVITTALIFAKMKEVDEPGTFQFVVDEIMQANNLPKVIIPSSVYKQPRVSAQVPPATDPEDIEIDLDRGRKRDRSGEAEEPEEREGAVGYTITPAISLASLTSVEPVSLSPPKPPGKKEKKDQDPKIIVVAPSNLNFTKITDSTLYKELRLGKRIKYFYREKKYDPESVKRMLMERLVVTFTAKDIMYVDVGKFNKIVHGSYINLDPKKRVK